MTSARVLQLRGPRHLEISSLPVPDAPPSGGAILRVLANGICGSDYDLYTGAFTTPYMRFPLIPGHEILGVIECIDESAAQRWAVGAGDRVAVEAAVRCGECESCRMGRFGCLNGFVYSAASVDHGPGLWGGMAQYMVLLPGSSVFAIPNALANEVAALFNVFGNAMDWTSRVGQVGPGDRVVVLGSGQRGLACCAVASACGAAQVVVTGLHRDAEKLALALELGATDAVDVEGTDPVSAVLEAMGGAEIDVVIDTTPRVPDSVLHGVELLRQEGRLVLAGLKGRAVEGLSTDALIMKSLSVHAVLGTKPASTTAALRLLANRRLPYERLYTRSVSLEEVEHVLQVIGGEHAGEVPIHLSVDPWS